MLITDVTPLLQLTYEQAVTQMLTYKRKGWGKKIEVDMGFVCTYCGKDYEYTDDPLTCSDRCSLLLEREIDERRGK